MKMIEITGLRKTFNRGAPNEVRALQGIDLDIDEGDFVTIIGTNGSGKSTLLNAVAGVFLPDRGAIKIDGIDVSRTKDYMRAKFISRVFQNPYMGTAPDMTIAENLLLAVQRGGRRCPKISLNRACMTRFEGEVALLEMNLEKRLLTIMGALSGGQRQALTLLMAVIKPPKVRLSTILGRRRNDD